MKLSDLLVPAVILSPSRAVVAEANNPSSEAPLKLAIIGAGAAGSSTAYHLQKFAAARGLSVNITIFERNAYVGGRTTTVNAFGDPGQPVEIGGSIFVEVNKILVNATKDFHLSTSAFVPFDDSLGDSLGVWDGEKFVITQSGGNSWWDIAKLLWKYGMAPVRTMNLMKVTVGKFLKLYEEPTFPWTSLTQVAQDVGLLAVTAATGEQYMAENGITGAFGHDIVQASTRVNYAQNLRYMHGLEAMVCMATEGAMSVYGGNFQIFEHMIAAAKAEQHLNTTVNKVETLQNGSFALTFDTAHKDASVKQTSQLFDGVVLAAPYQYADIDWSPQPIRIPDEIPYVQLHVTLFTSRHLPSPIYFGLKEGEPVPRTILTTLTTDEQPLRGPDGCGNPGFWSISNLRQLTNPGTGEREYLYKIFSPAPINSTSISRILGTKDRGEGADDSDVSWIYRKIWNSYPYEYPRVTFEYIQLAENIWYTSGIESFISTMETSALMGMNVARLIVDHWNEKAGGDSCVPSALPSQPSGSTKYDL